MKINETYKIIVEVGGKILTYTGKIISIDDTFLTFQDRYGAILSYNKNKIVSTEELK